MIRIGVTGTGRGVGKTTVAAALLTLLVRQGRRAAGMKPVETGRAADDPAGDAVLLRDAAGEGDALDDVRPVVLPDPLVPWVAAERAGSPIDVAALDEALRRLAHGRDAVVVEGSGGLVAPVTRDLAWDGVFVSWELDLVIVARDEPDAIDHTLLTLRAADDAGLRVRGVVLNHATTHAAALGTLLEPVPLFLFPHLASPRDLGALADAAAAAGLHAMLRERVAPADRTR